MGTEEAILSAETFRFFRDLGRNNSKAWMDENRDRYKQHVVEPFRRLLDALALGAQKLHPGFCISGRTGENFSRINRDIRFANDKTPYYTHMYLCFSGAETPGRRATLRWTIGGSRDCRFPDLLRKPAEHDGLRVPAAGYRKADLACPAAEEIREKI